MEPQPVTPDIAMISWQVILMPQRVKFPLTGITEGRFRIDLIAKDITRTKNIVEKLMFNLYDLEKKGIQEHSEKIELEIDLYQMEDY